MSRWHRNRAFVVTRMFLCGHSGFDTVPAGTLSSLLEQTGADVLTTFHLAVLRAAVLFFEEELCPHGVDVMRPYFDEPLPSAPSAGELRELRRFLQRCELWSLRGFRATARNFDVPPRKTADVLDRQEIILTVLLSHRL